MENGKLTEHDNTFHSIRKSGFTIFNSQFSIFNFQFFVSLTFLLLLGATPARSDWLVEWNPVGDLYPRYLADPRRPRNIAALSAAFRSDIPGSGDLRFLTAIGDQHSMVRFYRRDAPLDGWQFDVEARYFAQFDIENALDELGHDERLGIIASRRLDARTAVRGMFFHTSSHMGDEYILRNRLTEAERISSRKEEFAFGLSRRLNQSLRTYGEIGFGINLGKLNRPLRAQAGLEYESGLRSRSDRSASLGWYSGVNVTGWEENDWRVSATLQTGIVASFPASGRHYRLAVELYDGRSQLDAFFLFRESYITVGVWLDL
jgi:hypothetical protein